ncbi:WYL domain-containing protein [bacterium]|nr:WYL domain-containing protein [bacterium]
MSDNKPRYSRVSDIIDLIIFMQSKLNGVSILDIQERFDVSRRTAERMRDSVLNIMPSVDEIETNEKIKRWGFINHSLTEVINFSNDEIVILENLKKNANKTLKSDIGKIVAKLKAFSSKNNKVDIEKEIEYLMHFEGCAVKQMPKYKVDLEMVSNIREAVKNNLKITAKYNNKNRILSPLGLIYGEKTYLLAREKAKGDAIYSYTLHKFENATLTKDKFDRGNFDLQEYANRSFGVYQSDLLNVKLSFTKELAPNALKYHFHPTQKIKEEKDGTLTVTFKASGSKEIIWHVFKWGAGCKILAPKELKNEYKKYLQDCLSNFD